MSLARPRILAPLLSLAAALPASAAHQPAYDNIISGTDLVAFFGDTVIDDVRVEFDGPAFIVQVTVALTAPADSGPQTSDITVLLARDGGDGMPSLDGSGDDAFVVQAFQPAVEVPAGGLKVITLPVIDQYAGMLGSTLFFVGIQSSNPLVAHAFNGAPVVGETDPFVYSLLGGGPVQAPGVKDPTLTQSMGLGIRIDAHLLPSAGPGGSVLGTPLGFEELDEGFVGPSVALAGATFERGWDGFPPPADAMFAVDDGTTIWESNPDMLDFVDGKCLQLNAFSTGPDGYTFSLFRRMYIVPDAVQTSAAMSVNYVANSPDADYRDSRVTLVAWHNGVPVASDSITTDRELGVSGGGSFTFGAGRLSISGVEFDELVLFAMGSGGGAGGILGGLDNVVLGSTGPLGDVDADGLVGVADLLAVLAGWGECSGVCAADVNRDGVVDVSDLLVVLANWS